MVLHLNSTHFQAPGGNVMKVNMGGLVFVMFKQQSCGHCRKFMPQFEAMAQREQRVRFACVDVAENNRRLILMAQTTNTPIRMVPMFVMYFNGAPYALYKGLHEPNKMLNFIDAMIRKTGAINSTTNFMSPIDPGTYNIGPSRQELNRQRYEIEYVAPDKTTPYNADYLNFVPEGQRPEYNT